MAYDSRESLMQAPMDEFEAPKVAPDGHYYGTIVRHPEWRTQAGTRTNPDHIDVLGYPIQLTDPSADVEESKLDGIELTSIELPYEFWVWNSTKNLANKNAMYYLRKFHKSLGLDETLPNEEVLVDTVGQQVLVQLGHRTYKSERSGEMVSINYIVNAVGTANKD